MCDVVTGAESSREPLDTDGSLILHQPDYIGGSLSVCSLLRHTLDTDTGVGLGLGLRLVVTKLLASSSKPLPLNGSNSQFHNFQAELL